MADVKYTFATKKLGQIHCNEGIIRFSVEPIVRLFSKTSPGLNIIFEIFKTISFSKYRLPYASETFWGLNENFSWGKPCFSILSRWLSCKVLNLYFNEGCRNITGKLKSTDETKGTPWIYFFFIRSKPLIIRYIRRIAHVRTKEKVLGGINEYVETYCISFRDCEYTCLFYIVRRAEKLWNRLTSQKGFDSFASPDISLSLKSLIVVSFSRLLSLKLKTYNKSFSPMGGCW